MKKIDDAIQSGPDAVKPTLFILTRLYRRVLQEMEMTPERFNELMTIFVVEPGLTRKQQTDRRGKLMHSLASANVSLRSLINGLRMLKATRVTFALRVEFQDRPEITVEDTIQFHHPLHNPHPNEKLH